MSLGRAVRRPSKRQLGVWYVAGVALALALGVAGYTLLLFDSTVLIVVGVGIGGALLATVGYLAYLLRSITVSDALIWEVAQWTALGIAVSTLVSLVIGFGRVYLPDAHVIAGLLVATITGGSLLGAMLGVVSGLKSQRDELDSLAQRNTVLNRVLRHNIKNDMNVILGHTTLLDQTVDDAALTSVEAIERAAQNVTRLSKTARQIDRLNGESPAEPIDAAATVGEAVDGLASMYPEATFATDLPEEAWVRAGDLLRPAVENLLENAVEHNDDSPTVTVGVRNVDSRVIVSVADDGPGIYEHERAVLDAGDEGPIRHGSGLGLWLVKWFVEQHDGDLRFEPNEPSGTVVELDIPAADPADRSTAATAQPG
jgi:signal transduction histidine kinase